MKKANIITITIICAVILVFLGVFIFVQNKGKQNTDAEQTLTDSTDTNNEDSSNEDSSNEETTSDTANTFSDKVNVTIESVSGAPGSTVTVPVKFETIVDKGVGSCNFNIEYDNTKVEAVEVTPGDIIGSNTLNLDYAVDASKGMVSILFASDNEMDAITKAGVFVNINFKIKDNAPKGDSALTYGTDGSFGDSLIDKIDAVYKNGQITIE